MASHVVVTSSTARSTKVKVSPGTYMSDVLDQACKTLHLEAGNYLLKHKQRNVDLSVPFRISGLVGGAKLDLVIKSKSPSPVTVAVAIPPPDGAAFSNGRLGGTFPSSFTVWQVLRQLESLPEAVNAKLNITARGVAATTNGGTSGSGQLLYESPILNVMGRELGSFQDYQRTLSQLGYNSGSVLMRLSYKTTGITFFEAQQEISQYFHELEESKSETPASSASPPVPTPLSSAQTGTPDELSPEPAPDAQMQDAPTLEATSSQTDGASPSTAGDSAPTPQDPLAPVDIFSAPSSSTLAASLTAVDDDDFTPTIAHAQLHQASLQDRSKNKRLLSDKELAERAAATEEKISSIQSIEVKVRFPDMTSATWVITHDDTGAKLYKAVRSVMADPSLPFRLVISGSKDAIRDVDAENNRVMRVHKITGRVLLNVLWDDSVSATDRAKPFLKSSAAQAAKSIVVPGVPAAEEEEKAPPVAKQQQGSRQGDPSRTADETMKKIGKFFKLPGKK
ncbi:related to UBX domain protein [Cephalotrichum gorgonifer]|uniref:Related to UBX domain protein n=1 Tax=Cephalotrichum gorgonifer TaxID=2041049 RepID=A0AAE8SQW0_9PEZI|nr:related to UBX domain protein [Cephalotrichum gorgonifer]